MSLYSINNAGDVLESSASEFYVGFPRNDADGATSETLVQRLFVTTRETDPVPFTVETLLGFEFNGIARHNSTNCSLVGKLVSSV